MDTNALSKNTVVDLALKFAAATYEKQDGTDEEVVFGVLTEIQKRGEDQKKEFDATLQAMAQTNREGSQSYYEKITQSTKVRNFFVLRVLSYEMEGFLVNAEYREAKNRWEGWGDPASPTENFIEGFLNSIASMGDATLQNPILSSAMIAGAAGLMLISGGVLAEVGFAAKLVQAAPVVSKGLQWFGNLSGLGFLGYGGKKGVDGVLEKDSLESSRNFRASGEMLGNAFFSFSFGQKASATISHKSLALNETQRLLEGVKLAQGEEKRSILQKLCANTISDETLHGVLKIFTEMGSEELALNKESFLFVLNQSATSESNISKIFELEKDILLILNDQEKLDLLRWLSIFLNRHSVENQHKAVQLIEKIFFSLGDDLQYDAFMRGFAKVVHLSDHKKVHFDLWIPFYSRYIDLYASNPEKIKTLVGLVFYQSHSLNIEEKKNILPLLVRLKELKISAIEERVQALILKLNFDFLKPEEALCLAMQEAEHITESRVSEFWSLIEYLVSQKASHLKDGKIKVDSARFI
ncbi:MAG: hypothetical protein JNK65_03305 [Deltaproteobacteria bacterium]|nr:hypothetical protein [Deltaproteobacteria bacterium]